MDRKEFFISGIDTNCGKTYITGLLAKKLIELTRNVITTKLVQTGCEGVAEDILEHRRLMEVDLFEEDISKLTCPYVYSYPASPHLAIEMDKQSIDISYIRKCTEQLCDKFGLVLTEGAGGLMVPIQEDYLIADYVKIYNLPLILVSSSKLGSINHTLLCIDYILQKKLDLRAIIYNQMPNEDQIIAESTFQFLGKYLKKKAPFAKLIHSNVLHSPNMDEIMTVLFEKAKV